MTMLAHSARDGKPPQLYGEHVTGVVNRACNNIIDIFRYVNQDKTDYYLELIKNAAIYHDLGKLSVKNQDVLTGKTESAHLPIEHRDAGVKHLIGCKPEHPSATFVYAHHYPGLPNLMDQKTQLSPFRFPEAMGDSDTHLQEYLDLHGKETGFSTEQTSDNTTPKLSSMEYRVLLSCLVDADYSDTAGKQLYRPQTRWEERLKKLDCYIRDLQKDSDNSQSERNQLRSELYDYCRNVATEEFLVYCDSPVGTGKTTAVMAHMLKSASENGLRHIFVVMPYTNIISQTVDILRKALVLDGENPVEIVVEHHHQADFESPELRHLATTWTAPIIVTTAVQFFETIASNLPSKLRKLHQLPGSGIIIDESHAMLPIKLLPSAWQWITELSKGWGCRFCLCSGTSFKFWENPSFIKISDTKVHPLVSGEMSKKLEKFENNRIQLNILMQDVPHFQNLNELINCISQYHGSRLIVLNTVRTAALLAITLLNCGHDVLHLSTALTPNDRENVINEVKHRLNRTTNYNSDWTLVATSCVECGMDFSFHYGFCELRSLQSYLQLGGRISRNNEYDDGSLICFSITADGFGFNPAFEISRNVFKKQIQSNKLSRLTITNAVSESFDMECKEMGGLSYKICKYESRHAFVDVARNFRVIPDDTITVIADLGLAEKLRTGAFVSAQELQRDSVNIRKSLIKQLRINDSELPSLSEGQYDQFLGYMKTLL